VFLKKLFFFCAISCLCHMTQAKENDEDLSEEIRIGNFALPGSQRPGPLLGIGQNIIDKNLLMGFVTQSFLYGKHRNFTLTLPELLYGIRDDLSILLGLPIAVKSKDGPNSSSGVGDFTAQLEYLFYHTDKPKVTTFATVLGSMSFPTGNYKKNPPAGLGSPSFFLGLVYVHLATDWYYYTSYGAFFGTKHKNNKPGHHFVYQAGLGKNIAYKTKKWLLTWVLELSGTYEQKNKTNGITDNNSGGNTLFLCPSLWFSTQDLILQLGVTPIIQQHRFGNQFKDHVFVSFLMGWKFN